MVGILLLRNMFALGGDLANSTSKHVVVLGDDPKAKKKVVKEIFTNNKRPRTFYNHCKCA